MDDYQSERIADSIKSVDQGIGFLGMILVLCLFGISVNQCSTNKNLDRIATLLEQQQKEAGR